MRNSALLIKLSDFGIIIYHRYKTSIKMLIINYVLIIPSYLRGIWRYNLKVFCKYLGFKNVMLLALRVSSVSKKYFRSFINIQILTHFLQIIFWDTLLGKKKVRLFEYDILVTLSIWNSFVSIAIFQRSHFHLVIWSINFAEKVALVVRN